MSKRAYFLFIAAGWLAQIPIYFLWQSRPKHFQPIYDIAWCFIWASSWTAYMIWQYCREYRQGLLGIGNHMPASKFELLGWDNPHGRYPATVVPVDRIDGRLVAVYPGGTERIDPILEDAAYTHFTNKELETFRDFDHLNEQLFAMSEDRVTRCLLHDPAHQKK